MPTANYILINGKHYSPNHPLAIAWMRQNRSETHQNGPDHTKTPPKRIRQSQKPLLNKLEQEFFEWLKVEYFTVLPQSIRFMLGNGVWYKPDFVVHANHWMAYEVKGPHAFRGGFENLKVAAHKYPFIKWILVWKENGVWKEQEVLP